MRWASNNVGLYDAVNTAFLIRSANVAEYLISCFNGDTKLTRFEHQMGIFSLLALRHFRLLISNVTSGAIQVSQLPVTRKLHELYSSQHSTEHQTALRSENLYIVGIQSSTTVPLLDLTDGLEPINKWR